MSQPSEQVWGTRATKRSVRIINYINGTTMYKWQWNISLPSLNNNRESPSPVFQHGTIMRGNGTQNQDPIRNNHKKQSAQQESTLHNQLIPEW